jgi:hypothetical protein
VALVARDLGADESEPFVQQLDERGADRNVDLVMTPVDRQLKQP